MTLLTVLIPAYNESTRILEGALEDVIRWLDAEYPAVHQLLVVDDGSVDNTAHLSRQYADVVEIPHAGKAAALTAGIYAAEGEIVLFTDMDQATPITEAPKLLEKLSVYSFVVGSRGRLRADAPLSRRVMSKGQILLRDLLLGKSGITDTQCGFKAFHTWAAEEVLDRMRVYHPHNLAIVDHPTTTSGWDVEFLYCAIRLFGRDQVVEVPVEWSHQHTHNSNTLRDARQGVADLLSIWWSNVRGDYLPEVRSEYLGERNGMR